MDFGPGASQPEAEPSNHDRIRQARLHGLRILVVEDSADSAELIQQILEQAGAEVEVAETAEEAKGVLRFFSPHLIISDIGLPFQNGIGFIESVRTSRPKLPAIAITSFLDSKVKSCALRAGFNLYLCKPISYMTLIGAVREVLENFGSPIQH